LADGICGRNFGQGRVVVHLKRCDVIRSTKVPAQREALSLDKKVRWVLVRRFGSK
jgi:hypothetical protein